MNLQYFKDSKAVQFAIGVAVLLIVGTWFLTGDIMVFSDVMFAPSQEDSEGNPRAVPALGPIVGSMLFQAVCWIGATLISIGTGLWSMIVGNVTQASAAPASSTSAATLITTQDDVINLGRAAAEGDKEKREALAARIRLPVLVSKLQVAYLSAEPDVAVIRSLQDELAEIVEPHAPASSKRGGSK